MYLVVKAKFDTVKNSIGTWNIRSVNQGKLNVVKQEMTRVNINILGISELKWTGMGKFKSDEHYNYYCGKEHLWRNRMANFKKIYVCFINYGKALDCVDHKKLKISQRDGNTDDFTCLLRNLWLLT